MPARQHGRAAVRAVEEEPPNSVIVGWLQDLGQRIHDLGVNTNLRLDGMAGQLHETNTRLSAIESDKETKKAVTAALGERRIRRTDKRRHWINVTFGLVGACIATGFGELLHILISGSA